MQKKAKWYVVHTYSGYENKVKANMEKIIENHSLQEAVHEIQVPMEEVVEIKDSKKRTVMRKKYPGYVLIKMVMTDEMWYIVRNTRGVTGFVGPASKPVPLTDEEAEALGVEGVVIDLDYNVGDVVKIVNGPLESFTGTVEEISEDKKKVKVMVSMFGRNTPVDLNYNQIQMLG